MRKKPKTQGAIQIVSLLEPPAVRLQVMLDGKPASWVEFDTPAKAWYLVDLVRKHVTEVFGAREEL